MAAIVPLPQEGDWVALNNTLRKLSYLRLGTESMPTFNALTLSSSLSAGSATFDDVFTTSLSATSALITYASITTLACTSGTFGQVLISGLTCSSAVISNIAFTIISGTYGGITNIYSKNAYIDIANITNLNCASANISTLNITGQNLTVYANNQSYSLGQRTTGLYFQANSNDQPTTFELFTKKGDNGDRCEINIWTEGTPSQTNNRSLLQVGGDVSNGTYVIRVDTAGTASLKHIKIYASGNASQMVVNHTGSVDFGDGISASSATLNALSVSTVNCVSLLASGAVSTPQLYATTSATIESLTVTSALKALGFVSTPDIYATNTATIQSLTIVSSIYSTQFVGKNDLDTYFLLFNDGFYIYTGGLQILRAVEVGGGGTVDINAGFADVDFNVRTDGGVAIINGDAALSVARLGNATTNYTEFNTNGFQTLVGNARVKKEIEINSVSLAPGSTGPDEVILGNYIGYSYDIGDDSVGSFELPHDWDSSTDLQVYIYWYINEDYATNDGEVQWRIQWSACPTDESEVVDAPTHTGTIDFGDQDIPTNAKELTKSSAGTIAASSLSEDDVIGFTVDRVALDDGSNPTADPVIVRIEVSYTSNKHGEAL